MSVIEKVKRVLKKQKQEVVEIEPLEEEILGAEARLDSLHLYHLEAANPQKDPQE